MNKLPLYDPKISTTFDFSITSNEEITRQTAETLFQLLKISTGNKDHVKLDFIVTLLLNMKLSLYNNQMLAISMRPEYYAKSHKRYRPATKTYDTVRAVLYALVHLGYIKLIRGIKKPGHKKGVQTKIAPTEKLAELITGTELNETFFTPPPEVIILRERTPEKKDVNYKDTYYIKGWRKDLCIYNKLRAKSHISLNGLTLDQFSEEKNFFFKNTDILGSNTEDLTTEKIKNIDLKTTFVKRIFCGDFTKGGRIYGGSEQQLPSQLRKLIHINGEQTVELDYSSYHIRMLYHLKKRDLVGNAYSSMSGDDPVQYKIYKNLALRCINCYDEKTLFKAFREFIVDEHLIDQFPNLQDDTLKIYLEKFKKQHSKIKQYFLSDKGIELQFIDSKITNNIIKHFCQKPDPVLVLPIHDSFIISAGYEDELKEVMNQEYFKVFKKYPEIKKA